MKERHATRVLVKNEILQQPGNVSSDDSEELVEASVCSFGSASVVDDTYTLAQQVLL